MVPFWNQNGIIQNCKNQKPNNTVLVLKCTKNYKNFIKSIFWETMAFKLSNDTPTMPKTFLEHILSIFEVWSTSVKNAILPDFGDFW